MEFLRTCLQDLRYAVRNLLRSRGFTAVAAITLTVGIGANTAIFSIIDTILLRPLPFRDPGQLVRLYETEAAPGNYPFAGPDFLDWRAQNKTFQDMALFGWSGDMNLSGEGRPDHVLAVPTQANFFAQLGSTAGQIAALAVEDRFVCLKAVLHEQRRRLHIFERINPRPAARLPLERWAAEFLAIGKGQIERAVEERGA